MTLVAPPTGRWGAGRSTPPAGSARSSRCCGATDPAGVRYPGRSDHRGAGSERQSGDHADSQRRRRRRRPGPTDPVLSPDGRSGQGSLGASRVRSGFLPNILAFGLRRQVTPSTRLESSSRSGRRPRRSTGGRSTPTTPTCARHTPRSRARAGSLLVGRALSLFSRGGVEIDFLYGHGWAVGNPAGFDEQGPTAGHIGYGIIAPVFVAGIVYATPKFHGLQLTAGYYDPATTVGIYWGRTKYGRPGGRDHLRLRLRNVQAAPVRQRRLAKGLLAEPRGRTRHGQQLDVQPEADVDRRRRWRARRDRSDPPWRRGAPAAVVSASATSSTAATPTSPRTPRTSCGCSTGLYAQAQVVVEQVRLQRRLGRDPDPGARRGHEPQLVQRRDVALCSGFSTVTGVPAPLLQHPQVTDGVVRRRRLPPDAERPLRGRLLPVPGRSGSRARSRSCTRTISERRSTGRAGVRLGRARTHIQAGPDLVDLEPRNSEGQARVATLMARFMAHAVTHTVKRKLS